ncbi:MAG: response regulator transcription factor [Gemmatimonadota bacterium]|nr:response regulator transcription factor [Gemmatimonadota bacterium]
MSDVTRVLVIEDDYLIRRIVQDALSVEGHQVATAMNGRAGLDAIDQMAPDLVILDLGLPDIDGVEMCRKIRHRSTVPIVVLTARHGVYDKITLLDEGADDYVTKPFDASELLARVNAQLRRSRLLPPSAPIRVVRAGTLTIDLDARTVRRDGASIRLTPTEWELIRMFVAHAGRTLTHRQIFAAVWGDTSEGDPQAYLRVHVANLRRKIELDSVRPTLIITEAGIGYRFEIPQQ